MESKKNVHAKILRIQERSLFDVERQKAEQIKECNLERFIRTSKMLTEKINGLKAILNLMNTPYTPPTAALPANVTVLSAAHIEIGIAFFNEKIQGFSAEIQCEHTQFKSLKEQMHVAIREFDFDAIPDINDDRKRRVKNCKVVLDHILDQIQTKKDELPNLLSNFEHKSRQLKSIMSEWTSTGTESSWSDRFKKLTNEIMSLTEARTLKYKEITDLTTYHSNKKKEYITKLLEFSRKYQEQKATIINKKLEPLGVVIKALQIGIETLEGIKNKTIIFPPQPVVKKDFLNSKPKKSDKISKGSNSGTPPGEVSGMVLKRSNSKVYTGTEITKENSQGKSKRVKKESVVPANKPEANVE